MEIKIDTRNDSVEEIRKVISFLQNLIDERTGESETQPNEGYMNIFGDDTPTLSDSDDDDSDDKDDDDFKIMPYDF